MSDREHKFSYGLPLSDYALVGDGYSGALVSNEGAVEWWCPERYDAPSVCARILGRNAGHIATYVPIHHSTSIFYEPDTNVVNNQFRTADATVNIKTFMPYPRDKQPVLIQIIEGVRGEINIINEINPVFDYGKDFPRWEGLTAVSGHTRLFLSTTLDITPSKTTFTIKRGEKHALVISTQNPIPNPLQFAEEQLQSTVKEWKSWLSKCTYTGKYREIVNRSILTLKLLQHPEGAFVAAPTTSLPEQFGGVRNWDYRYMWLRDSVFIVMAFDSLGFKEEVKAFRAWLAWLIRRDAPDKLRPFYRVDGGANLEEQDLGHLEGYRNSSPVRIGNGANKQYQFDVFGEVMLCFHRAPELFRGEYREENWKAVSSIADFICSHWEDPNEDFWEVRNDREQFIFSKALGLVGLKRAIEIAEDNNFPTNKTWETTYENIKHFLNTQGFNKTINSYIRAPGRKDADASLLLLPIIGVFGYDKKYSSTLSYILKNLSENGFLQRYLVNDNLPGKEGAFLSANFWASNALADLGETNKARALFERAINLSSLGLYSEEVDAQSKSMLGNYPQALSHLSLILAAIAINDAEHKTEPPAD